MDERKQRILQAIIRDYVKTAEPVGSRTLARNYNLGISPATVRNEMFDLEQLGLLEQPHTSAGRIPSAKGYRYYVDTLLHQESLDTQDAEFIRSLWEARDTDFVEFLQQTAKLISRLSHNMGMFMAPSHDTAIIRFIHVLPLDETRFIMVVVTDVGALDNEPVYLDETYPHEDVAEAATKFNNALQNILLQDINLEFLRKIVQEIGTSRVILQILSDALFRVVSKRRLFYAVGTPELLGQPEFKNISAVQPILTLLEEQEELSKLLTHTPGQPITIRIGTENEDEKIQNFSIIQADFSAGKEHLGTLAILGPTRMEYGRVVGMLNYMQYFMKKITEKDNG